MMNSGEFETDKGSQNKMNPARVPNCHKKAGIKVDPEWSEIEHTENYVSTSKGIRRKEPKRRMTKKQRRRERGTDKVGFNKKLMALWKQFNIEHPGVAQYLSETSHLTIVPRKPGGPDSSILLTGGVRDYYSDGERV